MTRAEVEFMLLQHGAKLRSKAESRLMRVLNVLVVIVTFGRNRRFMTDYWTVFRDTIYAPTRVEDPYRYWITLSHECVHVEQWRRWRALFWMSYLLLPLPFGLAWFRWRWEREAYLNSHLRYAFNVEREIDVIVHNLWHEHAWTWPQEWMRAWFRREVSKRNG